MRVVIDELVVLEVERENWRMSMMQASLGCLAIETIRNGCLKRCRRFPALKWRFIVNHQNGVVFSP